jgi:hypothetical protein
MKDFTQYPEAFELKELGFNEPCFAYYHEDMSISYTGIFGQNTNSFWLPSLDKIFTAPTYSQCFRWFREKHNLKSWIQEHTSDTFIYEIRPHVLSDYKQGETYVYTNYEEAELACLKKLIEIVKGGNK